MAQITPPDYSKISSRQKVYSVSPAQERYRGPDENAGQVDLSTVKILDAVTDGLKVFSKIYAQSRQTADTLQAKGLLIDKIKDSQRIKESILLNMGSTAPEHLILEDVLQDYRTIDATGQSNLNIGEGRKHNISSLQMPEVNDNVRSMIEDKWVREEIGVINSIIDEVGRVQGQQIEGMLEFTIDTVEQNYINDTRNNPDKKTRRGLLANHLNVAFAEIDNLGKLGQYGPNKVRKQKDKVIQKALTAEFRSDLLIEGNRNTAIDNADKGEYKYKMEDGREIILSRATIRPYIEQRMSQRYKSSNDFKDYLSKIDRTAFAQSLIKDAEDSPGSYLLKYGGYEDGEFRITNEKIDNDPDLHQFMMSELKDLGPDADGNDRTATIKQQRDIKKTLLHSTYQKAIKDHEAEEKRQDGNEYVDANFNVGYIGSIIGEWQVHLLERVSAKRGGKWNQTTANPKEARRKPLGDKKLNKEQLAEVVQLDNYAEEITAIAEEVNNWTLSELNNKIKYLRSKKFTDDNFSGLSEVAQNILRGRVKDLSDNIAEIQLKESSLHNNSVFVGGNGQYKMEDVGDWQKAHGITNTHKIVPKAILAEIAVFKDETPFETKLAVLDKLVAVKYKFSGNYKQMAHNEISRNMTDIGMKGLFSTWEPMEARNRSVAINWLKGQNLELAK